MILAFQLLVVDAWSTVIGCVVGWLVVLVVVSLRHYVFRLV